jgi:hypothetical protein
MHAGTRLLFVLLVGQRASTRCRSFYREIFNTDEPCALLALSQSCVSNSCNKQLACEECIASSGSGEHCLRSVELCSASACWLQCQFPVYDDCVHKRKMATAAPRPLAPSLRKLTPRSNCLKNTFACTEPRPASPLPPSEHT